MVTHRENLSTYERGKHRGAVGVGLAPVLTAGLRQSGRAYGFFLLYKPFRTIHENRTAPIESFT